MLKRCHYMPLFVDALSAKNLPKFEIANMISVNDLPRSWNNEAGYCQLKPSILIKHVSFGKCNVIFSLDCLDIFIDLLVHHLFMSVLIQPCNILG